MTNYFEVNDDHLCEAVNCFEKPTTEIKLKVRQGQTITLHVCVNCINKFNQKQRVLESVSQPFSNTKQSIQSLSVQGAASTND
jgi:protein-arginine kinase activator protein McsA